MKVILVFWFPVFFSKACCNSDSWISLWNLFFCSRNFGDLFLISFLCPHYYSDVPCFMTHSLCWVLTGFFQSGNSCPYIQENILKLISLTFFFFFAVSEILIAQVLNVLNYSSDFFYLSIFCLCSLSLAQFWFQPSTRVFVSAITFCF